MLVFAAVILILVCVVVSFFRPFAGVILSILLVVVLGMLNVETSDDRFIVLAIFAFSLPLIGIYFSRRTESALWARTIVRSILAVGVVILGFALFGQWGSLGLLIVFMIAAAATSAKLASESATSAFVISTIGSSMRQNLPLPMALDSAATGTTETRSQILRNIKKWLIEGYSLSESIKRGYPKCPNYALGLIAAGEKIGQVPQAIRAIESDMLAELDQSRKVRPLHPFYPAIVLLVVFLNVLMITTFVLPKFADVLEEMSGTELPAATQILLGISEYMAFDFGWLIFLALILLIFVVTPLCIRIGSRRRRPGRLSLTSRIVDFARWHLPFLKRSEWNRSMARVVEALRLSLDAGCTVNQAIAATLTVDVNQSFKKRLKLWLNNVERGDDIGESARLCGLGSGVAWAFADVENHRSTLAILETLESAYRWGFNRLLSMARFILGPCETIAMGLIVGFIFYAVFVALVEIIYSTASIIP